MLVYLIARTSRHVIAHDVRYNLICADNFVFIETEGNGSVSAPSHSCFVWGEESGTLSCHFV